MTRSAAAARQVAAAAGTHGRPRLGARSFGWLPDT